VFCREPPSSLTISIVSGTIACSNRTLTKLNSVTVAKPTDRAQNFWHWLRWPDSCWNPIPSRIGCQRAADHASAIARMSSPEALTKPPEMQQAPKPHGTAQTRRLSLQIVHYQHHGLCSSTRTASLPTSSTSLTGRQRNATHVTECYANRRNRLFVAGPGPEGIVSVAGNDAGLQRRAFAIRWDIGHHGNPEQPAYPGRSAERGERTRECGRESHR
jgi:hypothetical protein